MILLVCLDEKGGMLFGKKRQSRDSLLIERVLSLAEGKRLLVSPYSAPLFPEGSVTVCADPAAEAGKTDLVFLEDTPLPTEGVTALYLYKWNRHYPGTRFFTLPMDGFSLNQAVDFVGSSHDCITEERWTRL